MQSSPMPQIRLSFYLSSLHKDFEKSIQQEVSELRNLKIPFDVFEDEQAVVPLMSYNGAMVAGLNNITKILREILSLLRQALNLS